MSPPAPSEDADSFSSSRSHSFDVIYSEDLLRDAVRAYVWQRFVLEQKRLWLVALVMTGVVIAGLVQGSSPWGIGLAALAAAAPVVLLLLGWWVHNANTLEAYRRLRSKRASFTLQVNGMDIASDQGSGFLPWTTLTEVWDRPRDWMIFTGKNRFNVIPKANVPPEAQAFFREMNRTILKDV